MYVRSVDIITYVFTHILLLSLCSKMVDEISTGGEDKRVLQVLSIQVVVMVPV